MSVRPVPHAWLRSGAAPMWYRGGFGARASALLFAALLLATQAGCEKTFRDMYDQPRYKPLAPSPLWADGRSARPPVANTVAHSAGALAGTSSGRVGIQPATPEVPLPVPAAAASGMQTTGSDIARRHTWTLEVLARGRERFDIYCAPCHSVAGDGDGMIVRRGFPRPPSYHVQRLVDADDEHFYAVITHGYGAMYPYADRVPPDDRRAIIAYIRALQLSQAAMLADVPADARAALEKGR